MHWGYDLLLSACFSSHYIMIIFLFLFLFLYYGSSYYWGWAEIITHFNIILCQHEAQLMSDIDMILCGMILKRIGFIYHQRIKSIIDSLQLVVLLLKNCVWIHKFGDYETIRLREKKVINNTPVYRASTVMILASENFGYMPIFLVYANILEAKRLEPSHGAHTALCVMYVSCISM